MTYSIPKIQPLVIGPMTGIEAFGPPPVQFGTVQMVGCSPNVSSTIGLLPLPSTSLMPMFQPLSG